MLNRRDAFKGITLTIASLCGGTGVAKALSDKETPVLENQLDFEALIKSFPRAIQYIENPSEELQLLTVNTDGISIKYIKNPSDKIKFAAIENNASAIVNMSNPTQEMRRMAVEKFPEIIQWIPNPDQELFMIVAKKKPYFLYPFARQLSPAVRAECIRTAYTSIHWHTEPTIQEKWLAIKTNKEAYSLMTLPHEIVDYLVKDEEYLWKLALETNYQHPAILAKQVEIAPVEINMIRFPCDDACMASLEVSDNSVKYNRTFKFIKNKCSPTLLSRLREKYPTIVEMIESRLAYLG